MLDYRFRAAAGSQLFRLLKGAYTLMWNKIVEKFLEKLIKKHFGLSAGISVDHMEIAENKGRTRTTLSSLSTRRCDPRKTQSLLRKT